MSRFILSIAIAALSFGLLTAPAVAKGKKDPAKITCEEFAAQTPEGQRRITAYLDGYSKRGKKVVDVGDVDVQRELNVLVVSCVETPKANFWDKVKMHLPGGKKKVKPVAMTCEDYLSLSSDVQPEVAYWLAGYNAKTDVNVAGEVDLETDTAVLVQDCKATPKASVWERIKKKF